jgi:hypothetical protein
MNRRLKVGDIVRYLGNGCVNFDERNLFIITGVNIGGKGSCTDKVHVSRIDDEKCTCYLCVRFVSRKTKFTFSNEYLELSKQILRDKKLKQLLSYE